MTSFDICFLNRSPFVFFFGGGEGHSFIFGVLYLFGDFRLTWVFSNNAKTLANLTCDKNPAKTGPFYGCLGVGYVPNKEKEYLVTNTHRIHGNGILSG